MRRLLLVVGLVLFSLVLLTSLSWAQGWGVGIKAPPLHVFASIGLTEGFSLEGGFTEITIVPAEIIGRPLGVYIGGRGHLFEEFELGALPWPLQGFGAGGVFFAPVAVRARSEYLFGLHGSVGIESSITETPFTLLVEASYGITIFEGILYGRPSLMLGVRLGF